MNTNDPNATSAELEPENSAESVPGEAEDLRKQWEVVEEVDTVPEATEPMPLPQTEIEPATLATDTMGLENETRFEDNSTDLTEEPITMSQSHDYANQQFEQFEEPTSAHQPASGGNQYYHYPTSPKKIPYLLIGGILLGCAGIAIILKLVVFKGPSEPTPSAADILIESTSGSPTPTPSPSQAPVAIVDKADLKIQVLNGSGVVGAAGKLATVLKAADYENIDTGNAANYSAEGVKIQVKDGKTSLGADIEDELNSDYEDITVKDDLDADSEYDVVLTLGKQSGDTAASGDVQGASDSADLKQPSDKKSN